MKIISRENIVGSNCTGLPSPSVIAIPNAKP